MKHFSLNEFLVSGAAKRAGIDMNPSPAVEKNIRALVGNVLDPLREALGRPVVVTSGYRPLLVNRMVGGADSSQHVYGEAADIVVPGMHPRDVCKKAIELGLPFDQLIQEFGEWTHVSFGPRNRRQVLTARKVGKTTTYTPGL